MHKRTAVWLALMLVGSLVVAPAEETAEPAKGGDAQLQMLLRSRSEAEKGSGRFRLVYGEESWSPRETAIVICDMWDRHWCQ
ncbi:MAG: nicotinamidase, partial [Planctomycetes bacterium]|nr:nicotinamidase [Planctomycetota bacterium]